MADIDYDLDGLLVRKRISDISEGGVFIDTPVPAVVGSEFRLSFSLGGLHIEVEGRVAYSQPYIGMGIEFTRISSEARSVISAYVAEVGELQPVG